VGVQSKDAARICDFLLEHRPHAVLVGAANSRCKVLKEDLDRLRDHILEHMPQVCHRAICISLAEYRLELTSQRTFPFTSPLHRTFRLKTTF
jgi:hypothetical protein